MGNKIIEAGFGNLLSFISWNTSVGPTIKNFAELNENITHHTEKTDTPQLFFTA